MVWYDHKGNVITSDPPIVFYEQSNTVPRWQLPMAFAVGVAVGVLIGVFW